MARKPHDWQWPEDLESLKARYEKVGLGLTPCKRCMACGAYFGEVAFKTDCDEMIVKQVLES